MIIVYVAGAFSSKAIRLVGETKELFSIRQRIDVEQNIRNAVNVGLEIARHGFFPFIPHANTAHPLFEEIQPYKFWLEGTLEILRSACNAMIMVPGWTTSSGAMTERSFMVGHSLPVFETVEELCKWRQTLP